MREKSYRGGDGSERVGKFGTHWFNFFTFIYTRNENNIALVDFTEHATKICIKYTNDVIQFSWDAEWTSLQKMKGEKKIKQIPSTLYLGNSSWHMWLWRMPNGYGNCN